MPQKRCKKRTGLRIKRRPVLFSCNMKCRYHHHHSSGGSNSHKCRQELCTKHIPCETRILCWVFQTKLPKSFHFRIFSGVLFFCSPLEHYPESGPGQPLSETHLQKKESLEIFDRPHREWDQHYPVHPTRFRPEFHERRGFIPQKRLCFCGPAENHTVCHVNRTIFFNQHRK